MKRQITVATYNICGCRSFIGAKKSGDETTPQPTKTGVAIANIKADVVGLNEVFCEGDFDAKNQTEKLAIIANMPYSFYAFGKDWKPIIIGNAMLSKYKLKRVNTYPVYEPTEAERRPNENDWYEDRIIISAVVDYFGTEIRFLITHFGLNGQEQERMIDTLTKVIDSEDIPTILMGDFNTQPHTEIIEPLYKRFTSAQEVMGNKEFTWATYKPQVIIDYIFFSKHFTAKSFEIIKENNSDHYPLKAVLEIDA